jgi:hypothetical protein
MAHTSKYKVIHLTAMQFHISTQNSEWNVDLHSKTCSCRRYTDLGVPCVHAVAACILAGYQPSAHVSDCFLTQEILACYLGLIVPPIRDELVLANGRLPPHFVRQPGRPKKRRWASAGGKDQLPHRNRRSVGAAGTRNPKCSICGEEGHYAKTCRGTLQAVANN